MAKKISVKIKKRQVEEILIGISLLSTIKGVLLGMICMEISEVLEPILKTFQAGLKNPEFDKLQQEAKEVEAMFADDIARKTAELSAINRKGQKIIKEKNMQLSEYEKIMDEELTINIDRLLPLSLLPEKETPSGAIKLLKPVLKFDKKEESA